MKKTGLAFLILFQSTSVFAANLKVGVSNGSTFNSGVIVNANTKYWYNDQTQGKEVYLLLNGTTGNNTDCHISKSVAEKSGFTLGEILAAAGRPNVTIYCSTDSGIVANFVGINEDFKSK